MPEGIETTIDSPFLIIFGEAPKDSAACPVLDPTASIQISSELIQIYQSRIDALINQLGKDIELEFDPVETPCPNCGFDPLTKRSNGIYKAGGPSPFPRGRKCPYCNGEGSTKVAETRCIKCLIKWNPKDFAQYGVTVDDPRTIVRTKGFLSDADLISKCKTAVMNAAISSVLRTRVRRIRGPIPVGLREDRYCVAYWTLVE